MKKRKSHSRGRSSGTRNISQPPGPVVPPSRLNVLEAFERAETSATVGNLDDTWVLLQAAVRCDPDNRANLSRAVEILLRHDRLDDADALLVAATPLDPDDQGLMVASARIAERRRDWEDAIRRWAKVQENFPGYWLPYLAGAGCAREARQFDHGETLLQEGITRFANAPPFRIEYARLAELRGDWETALSRWEVVRTMFPGQYWTADMSRVVALRQTGRPDEARDALFSASADFSERPEFPIELARLAEARRDTGEAETWWKIAMERDGSRWPVHDALISAMSARAASTELENALAAAVVRFPEEPGVMIHLAQHLTVAGKIEPTHLAAFESHINERANRPNPSLAVLMAHAAIANYRRDWGAYMERLVRADRQTPNDQWVLSRLHDAQELLLGLENSDAPILQKKTAAAETVSPPSADELTLAYLVEQFESLGGGGPNEEGWGFGCEFGLFQRFARIEPLGLLRWASIGPEHLIHALDQRFVDMGADGTLVMREMPTYDWGVHDTRYGTLMDHTHLDRSRISLEEARTMIANRIRFLVPELVDDLTDGEKIFVYRVFGRVLDRSVIDRLAAAVNAFGDNTLLFVTYAARPEQVFTAEQVHPGLIIGYTDEFAPDRKSSTFEAWEKICRAAYKLWSGRGTEP
jgi:tetratricopeptide (TPR) repeat protein